MSQRELLSKCLSLLTEGVVKATEAIVQSRVPASSLPRLPARTRFNLELDEVKEVRVNLKRRLEGLAGLPQRTQVTVAAAGGPGGAPFANLEAWSWQYAGPEASSPELSVRQLRACHKRIVVLLRLVYAKARLLPAYRHYVAARHHGAPPLLWAVSVDGAFVAGSEALHAAADGAAAAAAASPAGPSEHAFPPLATPLGTVALRVVHDPDPAPPPPPPAPRAFDVPGAAPPPGRRRSSVIPDYVGQTQGGGGSGSGSGSITPSGLALALARSDAAADRDDDIAIIRVSDYAEARSPPPSSTRLFGSKDSDDPSWACAGAGAAAPQLRRRPSQPMRIPSHGDADFDPAAAAAAAATAPATTGKAAARPRAASAAAEAPATRGYSRSLDSREGWAGPHGALAGMLGRAGAAFSRVGGSGSGSGSGIPPSPPQRAGGIPRSPPTRARASSNIDAARRGLAAHPARSAPRQFSASSASATSASPLALAAAAADAAELQARSRATSVDVYSERETRPRAASSGSADRTVSADGAPPPGLLLAAAAQGKLGTSPGASPVASALRLTRLMAPYGYGRSSLPPGLVGAGGASSPGGDDAAPLASLPPSPSPSPRPTAGAAVPLHHQLVAQQRRAAAAAAAGAGGRPGREIVAYASPSQSSPPLPTGAYGTPPPFSMLEHGLPGAPFRGLPLDGASPPFAARALAVRPGGSQGGRHPSPALEMMHSPQTMHSPLVGSPLLTMAASAGSGGRPPLMPPPQNAVAAAAHAAHAAFAMSGGSSSTLAEDVISRSQSHALENLGDSPFAECLTRHRSGSAEDRLAGGRPTYAALDDLNDGSSRRRSSVAGAGALVGAAGHSPGTSPPTGAMVAAGRGDGAAAATLLLGEVLFGSSPPLSSQGPNMMMGPGRGGGVAGLLGSGALGGAGAPDDDEDFATLPFALSSDHLAEDLEFFSGGAGGADAEGEGEGHEDGLTAQELLMGLREWSAG